jgi:hypothetical protein
VGPRVKVDCVFPALPRCLDILPFLGPASFVGLGSTVLLHFLERFSPSSHVNLSPTYISLSDYFGLSTAIASSLTSSIDRSTSTRNDNNERDNHK